jgi:hypothetical protein
VNIGNFLRDSKKEKTEKFEIIIALKDREDEYFRNFQEDAENAGFKLRKV